MTGGTRNQGVYTALELTITDALMIQCGMLKSSDLILVDFGFILAILFFFSIQPSMY